MISLVRLFKIYLREDAVYSLISSMIKQSKFCNDVIKKHFSKELLMTKVDNETFKISTKCWICGNDYNVNLKLKHNILYVFHNLKL